MVFLPWSTPKALFERDDYHGDNHGKANKLCKQVIYNRNFSPSSHSQSLYFNHTGSRGKSQA